MRLYLDHAATTPLLPEAREAMLPWLDQFGNPSSLYAEGRTAKDAIDQAREILSESLGCLFAEILFTSSGTEAANLAILGAALTNSDTKRKRILLGATEHHCVLHTRPLLEKLGYLVEHIDPPLLGGRNEREGEGVGDGGLRSRSQLLSPISNLQNVLLLSLMHANNETGAIQPVHEVAELCRDHGVLFHCDAVQTFLKLPLPDADLLTLSAHKVNGPKGVGAIRIRAGIKLQPLMLGGGQEREMRAGTENVAGIAGFAAAVNKIRQNPTNVREIRDGFLVHLSPDAVPTVPDKTQTLDSHAHVRFPGIDAETMLIKLDRMGVAASSGAACSSGSLEPSHVLLAMGYTPQEAKEGLRFTFGRGNTIEEAREAAKRVNQAADEIRKAAQP